METLYPRSLFHKGTAINKQLDEYIGLNILSDIQLFIRAKQI